MQITAIISDECAGTRLDKALASMLSDYSRTTIQAWLAAGLVLLDGVQPNRRTIVAGGESVVIDVPDEPQRDWVAEDIPVDIIDEDDALIIINKPPGMVVHPGAGNWHGTLLNALLEHDSALKKLPRAGIVHRLDKNTSGLLVIAKTEAVRLNLIRQFKKRSAGRRYVAVVEGRLVAGGTIDVSIGRNRHDRTRMAAGVGKSAISHYRIVSRYRAHTLVRVTLETGRTHQIRVHFRYAGFALVGDPEYGGRARIPAGAGSALVEVLTAFRRQALHAESLELDHPLTGERRRWSQGVPEDMRSLILALKQDAVESAGA